MNDTESEWERAKGRAGASTDSPWETGRASAFTPNAQDPRWSSGFSDLDDARSSTLGALRESHTGAIRQARARLLTTLLTRGVPAPRMDARPGAFRPVSGHSATSSGTGPTSWTPANRQGRDKRHGQEKENFRRRPAHSGDIKEALMRPSEDRLTRAGFLLRSIAALAVTLLVNFVALFVVTLAVSEEHDVLVSVAILCASVLGCSFYIFTAILRRMNDGGFPLHPLRSAVLFLFFGPLLWLVALALPSEKRSELSDSGRG